MTTTFTTQELDQISKGFDHGNYRSAYEVETYDNEDTTLNGQSDFFRIGYLLGFFSSYELSEIPAIERDAVEYYRGILPDYA